MSVPSVAFGYIYGYAYGIKSVPPCRYYLTPHKKFRPYNLSAYISMLLIRDLHLFLNKRHTSLRSKKSRVIHLTSDISRKAKIPSKNCRIVLIASVAGISAINITRITLMCNFKLFFQIYDRISTPLRLYVVYSRP